MNTKQQRLNALTRQTDRLQDRLAILQARSDHYAQLRLAIFLIGVLSSLVAFYSLAFELGMVLSSTTVVIFVAVVYIHRKIDRGLICHQHWLKIKRAHIARMRIDWEHIPEPPPHAPQSTHPFEIDLDLTGLRSIYHLIDTSMSLEGSQRLREWLLATRPDIELIRSRQRLVDDLRPLTGFRDKLRLQAMLVGGDRRINGQRLLDWLVQEPDPSVRPALLWAGGLAASNLVLLALTLLAGFPPLFVITLTLYGFHLARHQVSSLLGEARSLYNTFDRLNAIFGYLENTRFRQAEPVLGALRRHPPSSHFRQLVRVVAGASLQGNSLLWFAANVTVPWDLFFANQLNRIKANLAEYLPGWLDAWFELEALNSLANFAYLNPDYTFPDVGAAGFEAMALGHPLIPDDRRVRNDFRLDDVGDIVLITGSNMSGKSTFLRTVGVNLALAYAGGVVCASHLRTPLYRIYSSIKVSDSLADGISYFYAEVKRLKGLLLALEAEDPMPVLFLIDEIFRGTNNRERLIGSQAYIRALAKRNGLGLIATHDLELVKLEEEAAGLRNAHFREEVEDGRMVFDYTLRPGPSPTTNALKIMALEGLPVD